MYQKTKITTASDDHAILSLYKSADVKHETLWTS